MGPKSSSAELMNKLIAYTRCESQYYNNTTNTYRSQIVRPREHPVSRSPAYVAMEWDLQGYLDSTLALETLEVSETLSRSLNLDGESSDGGNDVERVAAEDFVFF